MVHAWQVAVIYAWCSVDTRGCLLGEDINGARRGAGRSHWLPGPLEAGRAAVMRFRAELGESFHRAGRWEGKLTCSVGCNWAPASLCLFPHL